jgi:hypothetical protein
MFEILMCLDAEPLTSYLAQLQTCMCAFVYDLILARTHVQICRVVTRLRDIRTSKDTVAALAYRASRYEIM